MKEMKKLLSFLLAVSIVLCSIVSGFAYSDIDERHDWASEAINSLSDKNIINGYEDGTLRPENKVTRAELAKMLVVAYELEDESSINFKDVKEDDWYYEYVRIASNIFLAGSEFSPERPATREETAYAIYAASKMFLNKAALSYSDTAEISIFYYDAVSCLVYDEIITGYPDNTFNPKGNVTRAEAVTMLYRAIMTEAKPAPTEAPTESPSMSPSPTAAPSASPSERPTPDPNIKANNYFFLVTRTSTVMENGDTVLRVTGINEGEEEEIVIGERCNLKISDGISGDGIQRNDIISFTRDYFGEVRAAQVLYRLGSSVSSLDFTKIPTYSMGGLYKTAFGEAIKLYRQTGLEIKDKNQQIQLYSIDKNVNVYIYKSGKLELSDLGMLDDTTYEEKGDYILALQYDDELKEILIIKE